MDDKTSSMSTVESVAELAKGTETETVRIEGAELCLIGGGQRSAVVRKGMLVVKVVRQAMGPLSAAFCMVGDHQWPLAMDSPVLRVGFRRFSFSLPGFVYGMALPESSSEEEVKRLEETLLRFCTYETHFLDEEKHDNFSADFWSSASLKIEKISNQMLARVTGEELKPEISVEKSSEDMQNKAQKAVRMSAIAKLVSKALLKGAMNSNFHVRIVREKNDGIQAFASIRAFTDVVDSVETAGRSILGCCGVDDPVMLSGVKYWNFNKSGLALMLRAVAASAMIHARASSATSVGRDFGCLKTEGTAMYCVTGTDSVEKPSGAYGL